MINMSDYDNNNNDDDDYDAEDDDLDELNDYDVPMVAASEADLVMIARAMLSAEPSMAWVNHCKHREMPKKIGNTCADLLHDTLSRTWISLWRRDGVRYNTATVTKDKKILTGRPWERHEIKPLVFSKATLSLLRWLASTSLGNVSVKFETLPEVDLTIGDQVMVYLAVDSASHLPGIQALVTQPMVRACPLAWLGFAHIMSSPLSVKFDSLTQDGGALVVELLANEISQRWLAVELTKRDVVDPNALIALGKSQDFVISAFLRACTNHVDRNLASFVIDAVFSTIARGIAPIPVGLDPTTPLSLRMQARNAAGAMLRGLVQWREWDTEHRGIRFIDDTYEISQLLLRKFEKVGSVGAETATVWLSELASIIPITNKQLLASTGESL